MNNVLQRFVATGLSATLVFTFSLAGVNLAQADDGNVAKNAKVSVSATGSCYYETCPSAAGIIDSTDTDIGSFWSGANFSGNEWAKLTLDQEYLLSKIRVYSQYWPIEVYKTEGCLRYKVEVSTDDSNWQIVSDEAWACERLNDEHHVKKEITFTPQAVKYIKVTVTNSTGVSSHLWRSGIQEIKAGDSNLLLDSWEISNTATPTSCTAGAKANGTQGTCAEVEIRGGTVQIAAPPTINFGKHTVSGAEQTSEVTLTDPNPKNHPNYFSVEDLKGAAAGYYATLQVTDLSAGSKTIAATNLKLKVTNGTVHTLGGSEDKNVKVPAKTQEYLHFTSSSPATLLKRSADSKGLLGKYGVLPSFQLTIPAYQTLGSYTGTMTYTLIEN